MKKRISYQTQGTCSRQIDVVLSEDGTIEDVTFIGGCSGNTQGVSRLVVGRKAEDVISLLKGVRCGPRQTSCPDQLAKALEACLLNA